MDIGRRLQELRRAKGLTQGDIERRTGLLSCYISRIENGHDLPSLKTLERLARGLDLELYQLFYTGEGEPEAPKAPKKPVLTPEERALLKAFGRIAEPNRRLLPDMARGMAAADK